MAIDEETLKAFSGVYDIEQPSYDRVITLDHMKEPVPNPLLDKDDVCAVVQINARGGEGPYAVAAGHGAAIRDALFDGLTPGVNYTKLTSEQAFDDEAARRIMDDYRERGWDAGEFWIDDARLVVAAAPGYGTAQDDFDLLNDWAAGDVYEIREYRRHEWRDEHGATMSTWDQTGYLGDVYLGGERDWTAAFDDPGDTRDAALAAMPDMPAVPTAAPDVHGAVR
ncbi:hypothetical protein B1400_1713 [Bifidobacterium italicum]|uniref:Uncharacterized protein n=1 Tax=Bifidobacterium italicum TaxID=1960968 RepID=A0A2A2EDT6_9BIFI|nr:hypothetical protein [Bifidobacterium italicum]PAU67150.1 hypothetical protein B1400_1713 [Bifidobacterium italicum]